MCADQDGTGFHAHGAGWAAAQGDAAGDWRDGTEKRRWQSEQGSSGQFAAGTGRIERRTEKSHGTVGKWKGLRGETVQNAGGDWRDQQSDSDCPARRWLREGGRAQLRQAAGFKTAAGDWRRTGEM